MGILPEFYDKRGVLHVPRCSQFLGVELWLGALQGTYSEDML